MKEFMIFYDVMVEQQRRLLMLKHRKNNKAERSVKVFMFKTVHDW